VTPVKIVSKVFRIHIAWLVVEAFCLNGWVLNEFVPAHGSSSHWGQWLVSAGSLAPVWENYLWSLWRPTMIPQQVVQEERFFLENQVFFNISAFLALSVSHLSFRIAAFASMGRTARALASEHMYTIFRLRSCFLAPVTFLLCGASSSQLVWLPDSASQEDRHSWKSNGVLSPLKETGF